MDREWSGGRIRRAAARRREQGALDATLRGLAALAIVASAASSAGAQTPTTGRLRGTVYDSIAGAPVEGAMVFVSGTSRAATTNESGRFEIDSVPAGRRAVTFSAPSLDSLGLFAVGRDVEIVAGERSEVKLATPSFRTVWRALCTATIPGRDSGIVYGTVASADSDARLSGARVVFSWWDIAKEKKNVRIERPVVTVRTDSLGNYHACGLPTDMALSVEVDAGALASGNMETLLPASRIARRDLQASADMALSDSARRGADRVLDDGMGVRRRGSATLRGEVRDAAGALTPNALVLFPSADTSVLTGDDGRFAVTGLPAGTQLVRVRRIGSGPLTETLTLRPGRTEEVLLVMPPATTLATVNVRADRTNSLLAGFDKRRRTGFGYYVGEKELRYKVDMLSALRTFPSLRVQQYRGELQLSIDRGVGSCAATVYLNGMLSLPEELSMYRPDEIYGLEVYTRGGSVPVQFIRGSGCGAVLVWTKNAR